MKLRNNQMIPFLASYIGNGGDFSQTRRDCLLNARKHLCSTLNESEYDPEYPTIEGVHCVIVDKQIFNWQRQEGGKIPTIRHPDYDASILIDDNAEICREAESAGITCIHVRNARDDQELWDSYYPDHPFQRADSFNHAVQLLTSCSNDQLKEILWEVWNGRWWIPPRVRYTVQQIQLYKANQKRASRSPGHR